MRRAVLPALVLAVVACGSSPERAGVPDADGVAGDATSGGDGGEGAAQPVVVGASASRALAADLVPAKASRSLFALTNGASRTLRVEPTADGVVLWLEGDVSGPRRIDVRRSATGLVFSGGPDAETELVRLGARPGDRWASGDATVHFDGWERITVPAGSFDVARVRTVTGPESLAVVQTWWFAPGTGLVRLRSDRGGVFGSELTLVRSPAP